MGNKLHCTGPGGSNEAMEVGRQKTEGTEGRQCKNGEGEKEKEMRKTKTGRKNAFPAVKKGISLDNNAAKSPPTPTPHLTHSHEGPGSAACPHITQLPFGGDILQIIHNANAAAHLDLNLPDCSLVTHLPHSLQLPAAVYIKFKGCWGSCISIPSGHDPALFCGPHAAITRHLGLPSLSQPFVASPWLGTFDHVFIYLFIFAVPNLKGQIMMQMPSMSQLNNRLLFCQLLCIAYRLCHKAYVWKCPASGQQCSVFFSSLQHRRDESISCVSTRDLPLQCWHWCLEKKEHASDREGQHRAVFFFRWAAQRSVRFENISTWAKMCFKTGFQLSLSNSRNND